uniref:Uncharacterized protein n=1 Tax=Glossina pallidipes TaxID=7398 RepID=A0A1A9ZV41_GLOPL
MFRIMFIATVNENRCSNNGSDFIRMFCTLVANLHIGRAPETVETGTSSCRSTPNWRNIFVAMFDHLLPDQFPLDYPVPPISLNYSLCQTLRNKIVRFTKGSVMIEVQ